MKRLLAGAALISAAFFPGQLLARPVEYVKICNTYGAGFFYIPSESGDRCYRPDDGQIRYETENGTVVTESPLAARVREMEAQMAISNALEDPDLVEGERFGIRLNWGATETTDAIGVTGAILLGTDTLASGGTRMLGTGGLGFADGYVGARFGIQVNW